MSTTVNRASSNDRTTHDVSRAPLVPLQRPGWLPESVWPFHTTALNVEGTRIAITDVGQGPVLLFVHTGFWSFVWRDVISRLAENFRCVCFDAPGTGRSDRLPTENISLDRAARTLAAVIEALRLDEITLVFHDLGGLTAIAGAGRVSDRIRALCAVNAFAWKPSGAAFRGMLSIVGGTAMSALDARIKFLPRITSSSFGVGRHFDEPSRAAFLAGIGTEGTRAFHAYMRDAARSESIYDDVDRALAGPFRKLPLVTVFGQHNDPLEFQPRWKMMFPQAEHIVVAKGNHFPMCDDPDLMATAIRRLS